MNKRGLGRVVLCSLPFWEGKEPLRHASLGSESRGRGSWAWGWRDESVVGIGRLGRGFGTIRTQQNGREERKGERSEEHLDGGSQSQSQACTVQSQPRSHSIHTQSSNYSNTTLGLPDSIKIIISSKKKKKKICNNLTKIKIKIKIKIGIEFLLGGGTLLQEDTRHSTINPINQLTPTSKITPTSK